MYMYLHLYLYLHRTCTYTSVICWLIMYDNIVLYLTRECYERHASYKFYRIVSQFTDRWFADVLNSRAIGQYSWYTCSNAFDTPFDSGIHEHMYIHTYTHTHIHAYYTHIHSHTYTHTCLLAYCYVNGIFHFCPYDRWCCGYSGVNFVFMSH